MVNKVCTSLFFLFWTFHVPVSAQSPMEEAYDLGKLEEFYDRAYFSFVLAGWSETELQAWLNFIRSQNDYHSNYQYVIDAELQTIFGTGVLAQGDAELGEKWHRSAIKTLMDGKQAHASILEHKAAKNEFWLNMGLILLNSFVQAETGQTGNLSLMPTWISIPASFENVPVYEQRKNYSGVDISRFPVFPGRGFLSGIGRMKKPGGSCTAFLVHSRIALTNWHCTDAKMTLRLERLSRNVEVEVQEYLTSQGWNEVFPHDQTYTEELIRNDWALAVLKEPVNDATILKLQSHFSERMVSSLEGKIMNAGYSGDLDHGSFLTLDFGCSLTSYSPPKSASSGIVRYDCRGWKGSSGGPVMIAGTDRVIALNSFSGLQWHSSGRQKTCTEMSECIRGGPDLSEIYAALRVIRQEIIAGKH